MQVEVYGPAAERSRRNKRNLTILVSLSVVVFIVALMATVWKLVTTIELDPRRYFAPVRIFPSLSVSHVFSQTFPAGVFPQIRRISRKWGGHVHFLQNDVGTNGRDQGLRLKGTKFRFG